MSGKRAKFKKSSSFKDLLERRKQAGLSDLAPGEEHVDYVEDINFGDDDNNQNKIDSDNRSRDGSTESGERSQGTLELDEILKSITVDGDALMLKMETQAKESPAEPTTPQKYEYPTLTAAGDRNLPMFRDFGGMRERKESDDNVEDRVHDQLPSVDEIKLAVQSKSARMWVLRRRCSSMMCLAATIAIISLFAVTFALKAKLWNMMATQAGYDPTDKVDQMIDFLVTSGASTEIALKLPQQAQRRAAMYVAVGDSYSADWVNDPGKKQKLIERFTLAILYYGLNGSNWSHPLKFLEPIDHCDWYTNFVTNAGNKLRVGVDCGSEGYVTKINLGYIGLGDSKSLGGVLTDNLPEELQNFQSLEALHLHNNEISGPFPSVLLKMPRLKSIALQYNKLKGTIPKALGTSLARLTSLGLGSNHFSGEIPTSLSNLKDLRMLGLDNNDHLRGNMNTLFGGLQKLEFLYLDHNLIDGIIDDDLVKKWANMIELDLSVNLVNGKVSKELLNMKQLIVLDLNTNQIEGEFPNDIMENTSLEFLNLQQNNMQGPVSDRLGFLSNLKHLDLSKNRFTGTLPDTLGMITDLKYLVTTGNFFDAQKIMDLSKLSKLEDLSFKGNNFTGTIPNWFSDLPKLMLLDLDSNSLTGTIPDKIGFMEGLKFLLLNRNKLDGTLPNTVALMSNLEIMLIDGNSIRGNADLICETKDIHLSHFSADCYPGEDGSPPEIKCSCCTKCCLDSDPNCNNFEWTSNYDPSWTYGFVRPSYHFSIQNAPEAFAKDQKADEILNDQLP
jgi:hypothetical protein